MNSNNYLVAATKGWNVDAFQQYQNELPGHWYLISTPEQLNLEFLTTIEPRYIFFPHWSWVVPVDILNRFECVCFHMTDVPYGRGGSPLQNLIVRGHKETKLTALRMVKELDAGPVYGKLTLNLEGRAEDIYKRASTLCYQHIKHIVSFEPPPKPQDGEVTQFSRRKPEQSQLPQYAELHELYDHIRMLDAPSYPKAFIEYGGYTIEFTDGELVNNRLEAKVNIAKKIK